ncbi:MAG: hypothetical protein PHC95_14535 [Parabacteroides sp.]|nr:hypothetical protein [Parabacteroides sp.]
MKKIILLLIMTVCVFKANAQSSFGKIEGLVKIILDYPLMKMDFTREQLDAWEYKVHEYEKDVIKEREMALSNMQGNEELSEEVNKRYTRLIDQNQQLLDEWAELLRKAYEESGMLSFTVPSTPQEGRDQVTKAYYTLSRYVNPTGEIAKFHVKLRAFYYEKWIPFVKSIEKTYKYTAIYYLSMASTAGFYTGYAGIMLQYISARDGYKSLNE